MTAKVLIFKQLTYISSLGEQGIRLIISMLTSLDPLFLVPGALICTGLLGLITWYIVNIIN